MPRDLKQVQTLMGSVGYKFMRDLSKRIRPITSLRRKGVKLEFTLAMEVIVGEFIAELVTPPILVFPDWQNVADSSRPFNACCDACIDGFGAALELDSERHWTPLDLKPGSIVWVIKRLRSYLWGTKFRIFSDHKALESISKEACYGRGTPLEKLYTSPKD